MVGSRVLLVPNHDNDRAHLGALSLQTWLIGQGVDAMIAPAYRENHYRETVDVSDVGLVVSLGGDGTLLRAARIIGYREIPLLGISYGHLGYLTSATPDNAISTLSSALAGELHVSRRSTLDIELQLIDEAGADQTERYFGLNEIALTRGVTGRMIDMMLSINGVKIDTFRGDGIVVSTATGSTGYALSAGGPLVAPGFKGMICAPIAPHTLHSRPVLTSGSDVVELSSDLERVADRSVFIDGLEVQTKGVVAGVMARRGSGDILLLNRGDQEFYESVARVFYHGGISGSQHA